MSGIEELKQKTKLSMDEMYDDQSVGIMEKKKSEQPANQLTSQPAIQPSIQQKNQTPKKTKENVVIEISPTESQLTITQEAITPDYQPMTNTPKSPNVEKQGRANAFKTHQNKQPVFLSTTQSNQKLPTCKMTFNLTEEIYKAFNDLYAKRMLQGRKTEKSDLICEAIQWLIKMEGEAS